MEENIEAGVVCKFCDLVSCEPVIKKCPVMMFLESEKFVVTRDAEKYIHSFVPKGGILQDVSDSK